MVATDFEIKFAQSRVDYFEKVLKKGEGDGLKTLLRAIKTENGSDYTASGIANAIKASKVILQAVKDAAVTKAAQLTTAANAMTVVPGAVVPGVTQADIDTAVANAKDATTKAAAMTEVTGVTQADIDTAVANAKDATTKANAMTVVTGVTQQNIDDAKAAALDATTKAAAIKVGDDPVLTAAKALLGDDTVAKIKADDGKDAAKLTTLYTDKAPDFMKNYGFINAILKNIPNAGKDVLKSDTKTFTAPTSITTQDKVDILNAYAKIIGTVCGADPFITTDLPEKDTNSHHVKNCLDQANKVAYALLADANCGKDKLDSGNVKADCLKAVAGMASDLYNGGEFEAMNIDLCGKYPYEDALPELTKVDL